MKTWRELEAQGVKRCCAYFKDGTRCRRRAVDGSWCAKHKPYMDKIQKAHEEMLRTEYAGKADRWLDDETQELDQ